MLGIVTAWLIGIAAVGRGHLPSRLVMLYDAIRPDLPCPWCRAQTSEDDHACPSCGRIFG